MLRIRDYSGGYRPGVTIVEKVSIDLSTTPVTSIVGSNGAGKSTLLYGICGLLDWHIGKIEFDGERVDRLEPHQIARRGIRMVPSGRGTFASLTVRENLEVGGYGLTSANRASRIEREIARFPRLGERVNQQAGMMSGGEQQMLAIARAMMSDPRVLILDEPSQGLAPIIVDQIFELIPRLAQSNVQVLLVEQDVGRGLEVSDTAYVVEKGRISMSGKSADLAKDERVKEFYLGIV